MRICKKILLSAGIIFLSEFTWAQPIANFTANFITGCSPLLVQFSNISTGNPTSYYWEFGNGNTSVLANPQASFVVPGKYTVKFTVSNASGSDVEVKVNYITVYPLPSVAFGALLPNGCEPHTTAFRDSSTVSGSSIVSRAWDFGNGNISSLAVPTNSYNSAGLYQVSLMVTDGNGCKNSLIKPAHVKVYSKPALKITAVSNFGCNLPFQTQFMAIDSPAGVNTYLWNFGNGSQSTLASPMATYTQIGSYQVSLSMVNQNGCSVSLQLPNFIQIENLIPDFSIGGIPDLCEPGNVFLLSQTNIEPFGTTYEWLVNGVSVTNFKNANLTNLPAGTYSVQLKVKVGSCSTEVTKPAFFTVLPSAKSMFTADRRLFCKVPATVQFTDKSTNATSWLWNFGDGTSSTSSNPTHTYTVMGDYSVRLITGSSNGCRDTLVLTDYIQIRKGEVEPILSPYSGCAPLTVNFSVSDTNSPAFNSFNWNFGVAGANSNQRNATYTYLNPGTYVVTLTATNPDGCVSIQYATVKVGTQVNPDFYAPKRDFCYDDQPVPLVNTTTPNLPGLIYHYGDQDSMRVTPNVDYIKLYDTGYHRIILRVNYNGCISYKVKENYISIYTPKADFDIINSNCSKSGIVFLNKSLGGHKFFWTFGDGKTGSGLPMTHDYSVAGKYLVKLLVIDTITGCSSNAEKEVVLEAGLTPSFTFTPKMGCMPVYATITNTTTPLNEVKSCVFHVGGTNYTGNQVFPLLYNPGKYTIIMTITDIRNCVSTLIKVDSIAVNGAHVDFALNPAFGCTPLLMQVRDLSVSDLPVVRKIWNWGTGDSTVYLHKDSVVANYTYLNPPTYQPDGYILKLTVVDSMGCRFSDSRKIYVSRPKPEFTVRQVRTCLLDSFIFTPIADDLIGLSPTYQWKFNGVTFTGRVFKTVYSGNTVFPVQLKVVDIYGCTDSIVKQVNFVTGPPQADFLVTPTHINCPGPPVRFFDQSKQGSSPIVKWDWEFGDGAKSNLQNPSRYYLVPGTYSVSLTLTDSIGCTDYKSMPNVVVIGGPGGSYSITPLLGCTPLDVSFSAIGQNVVRYEWDMGDGTIDTNSQTQHQYTRAGIYIPTLTLIDAAGCKVGLYPIDTIEVLPNPVVDFTVSKQKNCLGSDVTLTGLVQHSRTIQSYLWQIDSVNYTQPGPIKYHCNRVGIIPVSLTVTDDQGCLGSKLDSMVIWVFKDTIAPAPPASYRASVLSDMAVSFFFPPIPEPDFDYYLIQHDFIGTIPNQKRKVTTVKDTLQYFSGLQTLMNTYSYQLQAVDVCGNISIPGNLHTTIEMKATGIVNAISLQWTPYLGWDSVQVYQLFRLNDNNNQFEKIGTVPGNTLGFIDSTSHCHQISRYQVKGVFEGMESFSDTAAAIPLFESVTPQTRSVRATVESDNQVLVQWWSRKHRYPYTFLIEKTSEDPKFPDEVFELSSNDTFFIDKRVNVHEYSYTYRIYIKDACGGIGIPSNIAQTMVLKVDVRFNDKLKEDPVISWTPYQDWHSGIDHYDVFFYNDSLGGKEFIGSKLPGEILSITHGYIDFNQDDYCYEVVAYQKDSSWIESRSNRGCLPTKPRMYAPNAFTCNQDLLNDGFHIKGVFVKKFNLKIYDRWGTLLFETENMHEAWDGTFGGVPVPAGVYVYLATGYGRKGDYASIKGNVTLLR